jgi:hypothetical protein
MSWWSILKREITVFRGNPPTFMVSLMSEELFRDKIKNKQIKIYGDDNYIDMVDFKEVSIDDFLRSEQMMGLLEMDNIVVVTKGYFGWGD